jgi:hypothetical protein
VITTGVLVGSGVRVAVGTGVLVGFRGRASVVGLGVDDDVAVGLSVLSVGSGEVVTASLAFGGGANIASPIIKHPAIARSTPMRTACLRVTVCSFPRPVARTYGAKHWARFGRKARNQP